MCACGRCRHRPWTLPLGGGPVGAPAWHDASCGGGGLTPPFPPRAALPLAPPLPPDLPARRRCCRWHGVAAALAAAASWTAMPLGPRSWHTGDDGGGGGGADSHGGGIHQTEGACTAGSPRRPLGRALPVLTACRPLPHQYCMYSVSSPTGPWDAIAGIFFFVYAQSYSYTHGLCFCCSRRRYEHRLHNRQPREWPLVQAPPLHTITIQPPAGPRSPSTGAGALPLIQP